MDESGNALIPDVTGSIADGNTMRWIPLSMEFVVIPASGDISMKTVYKVKQSQVYSNSVYQYNSSNDAKVLIGKDFSGTIHNNYTIVCVKEDSTKITNKISDIIETEKKPLATPSDIVTIRPNSRGTDGDDDSGGSGSSGRGGNSGGGGSTSGIRKNPNDSSTSTKVKQGWILENDTWYYYSGTSRSTLKKGWHHDPQDGRWYYLDLNTGAMLMNWQLINNNWYYFNPYTPKWTWELRNDGEWYYKNLENSRPLGSMYSNEKTPDGYNVDGNGYYVH